MEIVLGPAADSGFSSSASGWILAASCSSVRASLPLVNRPGEALWEHSGGLEPGCHQAYGTGYMTPLCLLADYLHSQAGPGHLHMDVPVQEFYHPYGFQPLEVTSTFPKKLNETERVGKCPSFL